MDSFAIVWQILETGWPAALLVAVVVLWRLLMTRMKETRADEAQLHKDHQAQLAEIASRYEAVAKDVLAARVEQTALMRDLIAPTIERNTIVQQGVTRAVEHLTQKIEAQDLAERRYREIMQAVQDQKGH